MRQWPFAYFVTYSLECAVPGCTSEWEQTWPVPAWCDAPYPNWGDGTWVNVQGHFYCPKHILTVYPDGSVGCDAAENPSTTT